MSRTKVHRRQWLVSRSSSAPDDFNSRTISSESSLHLHFHPELRVTEADGKLLLGEWVGSPTDPIGRYVEISGSVLTLDAAGLMGVYYSLSPSDLICTSSIALAERYNGVDPTARELVWGKGINWDPLPSARSPGMAKLFCDQSLNLETAEVAQVPRSARSEFTATTAGHALAAHLANTIPDVLNRSERVFVPLTAGNDSRVIFAAALASGIKFEAFTYLQSGPKSLKDAKIASGICKRFDIRHHVIAPAGPVPMAAADLFAHSGGAEGDSGRSNALRDMHRMFRAGDSILSGAMFEVGRKYFAKAFARVDLSSAQQAASGISGAFREPTNMVLGPLEKWYDYRSANPIALMDYIDLFYLDQRLGGWAASNRQAADVYEHMNWTLLNSWSCVRMLMVGAQERNRMIVQQVAMRSLVPELEAFPINPRMGIDRIVKPMQKFVRKSRLARFARRLKHLVR